ncbi:hypothetical protein IC801_18135 [Geobacillus sp. 44B]|nr:hypothetical protein IC801_18135 [Geobacillus sp. 44B]
MIPLGQLQFEGLIVALSALGFDLSPVMAVIIAGCIAFLYISVSGVKAPALVSILKDILMFLGILIAGIAVLIKMEGVSNLFTFAKQHGTSVTIDQPEVMVFVLTTILFQSLAFYVTPLSIPMIFTSRSEATIKKITKIYAFIYVYVSVSHFHFLLCFSRNS